MKIETICSYCKIPIIKYSRGKKVHNYFCSLECKSLFNIQESYTSVNCSKCGKHISKKKSELKRIQNVFCSNECKFKFLTGQKYYREVVCTFCGKKFKRYNYLKHRRNPFCSQSCYFSFKENKQTNQFQSYRYKVLKETYKWRNEVIISSQNICYYTGDKLIPTETYRKSFPNKHPNSNRYQPTIDHKISIWSGFQDGISPDIIGHKSNLCVAAKYINSTKNLKNEFYITPKDKHQVCHR